MKRVNVYLSVAPQLIQGAEQIIAASMLSLPINNPNISFKVFENGHINFRNHYAFNNSSYTSIKTEKQAKEVVSKFMENYQKNIIKFIDCKKIDKNFPKLFNLKYLKHITSSEVCNKNSKITQYWILNYILELDSVTDEEAQTIKSSVLNNENISFYVGGQEQVIGLDYNHLPFSKTISTELMNVFASAEAPNVIYKRNDALNIIAPYFVNENFEYIPASNKSVESSNNSETIDSRIFPIVKGNLFPEITIDLIDQTKVLKKDTATNTEFDTVTDIYGFISLVEEIENKYSSIEQKNTAYMLTQFRKAYYDSIPWNTILIPNTYDEKNKFKISDIDKNRLKENRIVRALDSAKIDIGHVFVGMDAYNHQSIINFAIKGHGIFISNSLDAATWLGDLASAIAYVRQKIYDGIKDADEFTDEEIQAIWKKQIENNASAVDLLGDIDGVVMGANLPVTKTANGKKVSELLRDYYLHENNTTIKSNRMQLFTTAIGLGDIDGDTFKNQTAFIAKYQHEITDATLLVIANISKINAESIVSIIKAPFSKKTGDPLLNIKCGSFVLKAFLKALNDNWSW